MRGKNILIGITGSIAAYKAAILVRELVKLNANVKVVMTKDACEFITPLTLATLSKHIVYTDFTNPDKTDWNNHVELGLWADLMLIAPASANTIAKMANGICDNFLLAVYLSAKCPVMVSPAMDLDMYKHASTQENLNKLKQQSVHVLPTDKGELASGLVGEGRMLEPEELVKRTQRFFEEGNRLNKKKVLISAGPTYEAIDPVRFIGNHSSGKMGLALAKSFSQSGAEVILVCGPGVKDEVPNGITRVNVTSAEEMYKVCEKHWRSSQIGIMAAAVADFKPKKSTGSKIKKDKGGLEQIELETTVDILAELGKKKTKKQFLVGFALETDNEKSNAQKKLKAKNCNMIVLNSLKDKGAGFGHDTNKVVIYKARGKEVKLPLMTKDEIAHKIVDEVCKLLS